MYTECSFGAKHANVGVSTWIHGAVDGGVIANGTFSEWFVLIVIFVLVVVKGSPIDFWCR
jgi:hypothetical protein